MKNTDSEHFMFIEPDKEGEKQPPLNDWWTKTTELILECSTASEIRYKGVHTTLCGAISGNAPIYTPMGRLTNTLAPYYMKHYREQIPESEKTKVIQELMCIAGEVDSSDDFPKTSTRKQKIAALYFLSEYEASDGV